MRNSIVRIARVSAVVSFVVGLAATALQPVFATPPAAATATPRPATPKPTATAIPNIIVKPITQNTSVKSYKTQIAMKLDGKSESKVAKGDFVVEAQALPATKKQSLALGGSLMGQLLGKYLRGLPVSKLTLYLQDKNTFVLAQSLLTVCAVPKTPIAGLDQISSGLTADAMLASLSGSNKIYGTLIGDETVNGIATRHYKLDVVKMNALAKQNRLNATMKSGEVWLAKDGNYVVRVIANANGTLAKNTGVDFSGDASIVINVSELNKIADIPLPGQCSRPIQI